MSRRRWLIAAAIPAAVLMATPAFAKLSAAGAGGGSARATSITAPGAPTVNGTATSSSVPLQWTAASGPSGTLKYHVERAAFGGSSWTDVCGSTDAAPISGTSCSDGSVAASTDYQYRVTAEIGNWRKTSATSAKISTPAAATPGLSFSNVSTNSGTATISCAGTIGSANYSCTISPESASGNGRFMQAKVSLINASGSAMVNNTGSAISISLTKSGGTLDTTTLSIPNGQSVSSGFFKLTLANGSSQQTVTATATVSGNAVSADITS